MERGLRPEYLFYSYRDKNPAEIDFLKKSVKSFLQGASVFVTDQDTIYRMEKALEITLNPKEVYLISELILLLYPAFSKLSPEELCTKLGIKFGKRFRSEAHKECRLGIGFLQHCHARGLASDIGYLNRMEEYTEGLSIAQWLVWLKKEIVKNYPDRAIQTGSYLKEENISLFEEDFSSSQIDEKYHSPDWVINCFQAGGLLSQNLPGYEDRFIQVKMAGDILRGFQESSDILIEAGTGTGKSIAYLIPALWWAKLNQKRVVIATHTITLQEQLYGKDLPFLQKILPFDFKTALLKGKNNYVCLHTFFQEPANIEMSSDNERLARAGMFSWIRDTNTGDLGELPYSVNFSPTWKRYGADHGICIPNECRYAGQCFMLKARKRAEEADLIVVNHSLLLADVKTNYNILPEYNDLVIDEAHHLYQTALKQLGFELSFEQIYRQTEQLKSGLFYRLKKELPAWQAIFPLVDWHGVLESFEKLSLSCEKITEQAKELFGLGKQLLAGRQNLSLTEEKVGKDVFAAFEVSIENLTVRLNELVQILDRLNACLYIESQQLELVHYDILKNKNDLVEMAEGLKSIKTKGENTRVTYLEKGKVVYLKNTIIDVAGILREKIFDKNNCTILTSATLSVSEDFSYFARDVGLDQFRSIRLESPFDYESQMLFSVVNDIPINLSAQESLAVRAASFIWQIAEMMQGRTLVLFTSYRYLQLVRDELLSKQWNTDLQVLAQGIDGSREDLLQLFMKDKNTILLGTSSFWEGIDVPGEALRCVIMTKLPFMPPDNPIMEAKARLMENQGMDPFRELHLPEAIIRFKQGFGRLIRTKEDKGVVVLLDDRVIKKQYGKLFIQSLPIRSYFQGSSAKVIQQIGRWV
ncbi:MAG: DEAD/DEAH box helicase [Peptococcaceae bacterium]|nr:DEAD/DEAH box helicase [Peptococcaceae bacterium]